MSNSVDVSASMLEVLRDTLLADNHSREEVDALCADAKRFVDHLVVVVMQYIAGQPQRAIPAMCALQWVLTFVEQDIKPEDRERLLEPMRQSAAATWRIADAMAKRPGAPRN